MSVIEKNPIFHSVKIILQNFSTVANFNYDILTIIIFMRKSKTVLRERERERLLVKFMFKLFDFMWMQVAWFLYCLEKNTCFPNHMLNK